MTKWVSNGLSRAYLSVLEHFRTAPFSLGEAEKTGAPKRSLKVSLSRLARRGWLERVDRGRYRAVHPLVVLLEMMGFEWRSKVPQRPYLPLLEFVLARFLDGYMGRLRSVVLFGSVARGTARAESDLDLLVVADRMDAEYGARVREALNILEGWENVKWGVRDTAGLSPNLDLLLVDSVEAETTHPFYLDLVYEGIIMYDRGHFMAERFERLKTRLNELGSVRVQRPDGSWYWILVPNARDALKVVI